VSENFNSLFLEMRKNKDFSISEEMSSVIGGSRGRGKERKASGQMPLWPGYLWQYDG
jgi:hypothetical protein